jgi:hypothetical protein
MQVEIDIKNKGHAKLRKIQKKATFALILTLFIHYKH